MMTEPTIDGLLKMAESHALSGDWQSTIESMKQVLKLDPYHSGANRTIGTLMLETGDPSGAIPFLRRCLADEPGNEEASAALARAFAQSGQLKEAEKTLLGLLDENPENRAALNLLAQTLILQDDRVTEAVQILAALVQTDPTDPEALYLMGKVYESAGDLNSASDMFQQILLHHPGDERASAALAELRQAQDNAAKIRLPRNSREEIMTRKLSLHEMDGLEIGPLANPIVRRRDGVSIRYVDYADTDTLRQKYAADPNVETGNIVEVDDLWGEKSLLELYGEDAFDYVIASHVIEHVPDMIGWLGEASSVLRDGGLLSLAVPDRRFTFDLQRPVSTPGAFIEAHLAERCRPGPQAVFDHSALAAKVDVTAAWSGTLSPPDLDPFGTLEEAYRRAKCVFSSSEYQDVHVWIFTPSSFLDNLEIFCKLGLCDFLIDEFHSTGWNQIEFFVLLRKTPECWNPEECLAAQLESIRRAGERCAAAARPRA